MIKVGVIGASGKMGREVCQTIANTEDIELVFTVARHVGESICGVPLQNNLEQALKNQPVDAVVDFTHASCAAENAVLALEHGAVPIIGTSGLSEEDLFRIEKTAKSKNLPAYWIPNFAIGAVLMMKFSREAAKFFPDAEIIEMHHNQKADAPSGTALVTAEEIAKARSAPPSPAKTEVIKLEGARGGNLKDVRIHSLRLPGLLAHQKVIFGSPGEVLTIHHDSMARSAYMPGVLLVLRNFKKFSGLVVGLEPFL